LCSSYSLSYPGSQSQPSPRKHRNYSKRLKKPSNRFMQQWIIR
jgi:hypothetical protein